MRQQHSNGKKQKRLGSFDELGDVFDKVISEREDVRMVMAGLDSLDHPERAGLDPTEAVEEGQKRRKADEARQVRRDDIQRLLEAINKGVLDGDLDDMLAAVMRLAENPHLPYRAKQALTPLANAIRLLKRGAEFSGQAASAAKQKIDDAVATLNTYLMSGDAREQNSLRIDVETVYLPLFLDKPTVVEKVPIVLSTSAHLPRKIKALAANVYIVTTKIVGVPFENSDLDKAFERARRYCVRFLRCEPSAVAMRRPDSDVVWFPLLPFQAPIEVAIFPDQARLHDPSFDSPEARRLRQEKQREARLTFEADNRDLYLDLEHSAGEHEKNRELAQQARAAFIAKFGLLPNAIWARIKTRLAMQAQEHMSRANGPSDRLAERLKHVNELFEAEHVRDEYLKHLARARYHRNRVKALAQEIDERKLTVAKPHLAPVRRMRKALLNKGA